MAAFHKLHSRRALQAGQRGAALLLAMMILALVTTLTAGMVWHQRRAVQVEAAERARVQAGWVLRGALDWSRLIMREDLRAAQRRANFYTWGRDAWGTPLAEVSLSSFLATDKDNNADAGLDAAISGGIADAQGKFNLRGLVDATGKVVPAQVQGLQRLCDLLGAPGDLAARVAEILSKSLAPQTDSDTRGPPIRPDKLLDLAWQGLNVETLNRLAPYIELLPLVTPVNVNTAPREVLVAAIDGLDTGAAERLVQSRQRAPFETLDAVRTALGGTIKVDETRVGVSSAWFEVSGQLRLDERVVEERSLVQRDGDRVVVRRRERHSFEVAPR
jgi:general secretion pathway protein K